MQYRRFGRTELQMPVFSCGGMRYQYKWQDVPPSQIPEANQRNLEATILRSLELGINHIETARGYGSSEMQLGKILPTIPREKLIFQTKIAPKPDPKEFRRQFKQSFQFLGLEYIDLLGIHGINNEETLHNTIRPGGCLDEARKLQKEGKVRFIGFSTHGSTEIITKAINTGEFDYVNLHWYYINQENWSAIEAATKQDMGVFIISPSDKGGKLYEPPQKLVDLCQPLSPMVFNDLFCLSHPQVHTLSLGAAKPSDFDEHLKVLPLLDKAEEILPPIIERLEQAAIATLGENWFKTWREGLPSYQKTPGNINIPVILWLRNLALAYDMTEYSQGRYNLLESGGHWFPGATAKNVNQYNLKDCLKNSPHKDKITDLLQESDRLLGGAAVKRLSQS
ncbi:putative oxidoreductase of aldo/keto reductase family [Hyella patelloides LEGE 07179]|uniref:Putative oxidoreductase of aldo/keto reductase family n=1 Tax=Hyella patelloides LEGE 07179 TaxID=945734 RepID=A0A563VQ45_9CYAN|nr:aldo/keto reductase [Hyella patelloides]VEP13485.1 putative oxidoreductase of aldo/keto reductase family [Hyella patelloides LEGE 07179]